MTIKIDAATLYDLLYDHFTREACEAICEVMKDLGADSVPYVYDLRFYFSEYTPSEFAEMYGDSEDVYAVPLTNGNTLVME